MIMCNDLQQQQQQAVRTARSEPALILLGPLADGFTAWLLAKGAGSWGLGARHTHRRGSAGPRMHACMAVSGSAFQQLASTHWRSRVASCLGGGGEVHRRQRRGGIQQHMPCHFWSPAVSACPRAPVPPHSRAGSCLTRSGLRHKAGGGGWAGREGRLERATRNNLQRLGREPAEAHTRHSK
jgi:hypothetical protein